MKYKVRITKLARRDVVRNADWWAREHSPEQAEKWFDAVHEQLQQLDTFPESNGLSAENDDHDFELRDKLVGLGSRPSYRAVITIKDNTVFVLRVRRSAEQRLHAEDFPEDWL